MSCRCQNSMNVDIMDKITMTAAMNTIVLKSISDIFFLRLLESRLFLLKSSALSMCLILCVLFIIFFKV